MARILIEKGELKEALELLQDNVQQYYMAVRLILNQKMEGRIPTHPKMLNLSKLMVLTFYSICLCHLNKDSLPHIWESLNFATFLCSGYFNLEDPLVKGLISFAEIYKLQIEPVSVRETEILDILFGQLDGSSTANEDLLKIEEESEEEIQFSRKIPILTEEEIARNLRRANRINTNPDESNKKSKFLVDYEYIKIKKGITKKEIKPVQIVQSESDRIDHYKLMKKRDSESQDKSLFPEEVKRLGSLAKLGNPNTSAAAYSGFHLESKDLSSDLFLTQIPRTLFVLKPQRPSIRKVQADATFDIGVKSARSNPSNFDQIIANHLIQPAFNNSSSQIAHSTFDR